MEDDGVLVREAQADRKCTDERGARYAGEPRVVGVGGGALAGVQRGGEALQEEELRRDEEIVETEDLGLGMVLPEERCERHEPRRDKRERGGVPEPAPAVPALAEEVEQEDRRGAAHARDAVRPETGRAYWDHALEDVPQNDEQRVSYREVGAPLSRPSSHAVTPADCWELTWRVCYAERAAVEDQLTGIAPRDGRVCCLDVHCEGGTGDREADRQRSGRLLFLIRSD